ncbi:uncharacterized protein [Narcine bancroftii]|uniref:uncharacterized protein isoform X2 n=1 Tax=Narcine bancroftii TaxID=1343680 RepID=UPI003831DF35
MVTWKFLALFAPLLISADLQNFTIYVSRSEVNAEVGDMVTLSVRPTSPVVSGFWKLGSSSIVTWTVEGSYLNVAYTKRNVHLLLNTSLLMRSVALADSGVYRVTMDSHNGQEATANITLNVFQKSVPLRVSAELSTINAEMEADVLLSVNMSGEVQSGNWTLNGWWLFYWHPSKHNTSYYHEIYLLHNGSLLLKSLNFDMEGIYVITLMSPIGAQATANITVNVFTSRKACTANNIILALLCLLALALILICAVYIQKKRMKHDLETFDPLAALCKGHHICFFITAVVTFCLIIICAAMVHKDSCMLGQRPALDFVAE